jgi:hypothetical protein
LETVLPTAFMPSMTNVEAREVVDGMLVKVAGVATGTADGGAFINVSSSGTTWKN